jgi:hypothetical protein
VLSSHRPGGDSCRGGAAGSGGDYYPQSSSIDAAAFDRLHGVLSRYYRLLIVDTGNNMRASNWVAAVAAARVVRRSLDARRKGDIHWVIAARARI